MSTPPNQLPPATPPAMSAEEIRSIVQGIIGQQNVSTQVQTLMTENFEYREKNRVLRADNEQLRAKVPAEGSVVLSGDDVKLGNDFKGLNLKPADITKMKGDFETLQGKVSTTERQGTIAKVAKVENWDPTVLGTLVGDHALVIEPVTEDVNGQSKAVDRGFINIKGADNSVTKHRLSEWIEKNHAKFLPSLNVEEGSGEESSSSVNGNNRTNFPKQTARGVRGKPAEANAAKDYLKKRYNPQQPAAKAGK